MSLSRGQAGVATGNGFQVSFCASDCLQRFKAACRNDRPSSMDVWSGVVALAHDGPAQGEGEALELAKDCVHRSRHRPGRVHVVDADVPLAAPAVGGKVARERGDDGTEVKGTVRGRGEGTAACQSKCSSTWS